VKYAKFAINMQNYAKINAGKYEKKLQNTQNNMQKMSFQEKMIYFSRNMQNM
jgi:hypothetical protein